MNKKSKNEKNHLNLKSMSESERTEFLKKASSDKNFLKDFIHSVEIDNAIEDYLKKEGGFTGDE